MQAISLQRQWTSREALLLIAFTLAAGIAGGWLIRGLQGRSEPSASQIATASKDTAATESSNVAASAADPARLRQMADSQAAPLIAKLNANPKDADTLISIGNLYYDAQQYSVAVNYYNRALQLRPSDASVRTDMATAYWYLGDADEAIVQFNKALAVEPTNPNTLFNLGLVKWQGKHDGVGATALWKKLLDSNPNYDQKNKVFQMLADVEKQTAQKP